MLGRLYENQDCSAARALELVGERWTLLILRDALFRGYTRFSEFERSLGLAPNVLAKRLDDLVDAGIMEAHVGASRPGTRTYVLTEKGQDLKAVVVALTLWGDKWVRPGPVEFVHEHCGGLVEQPLICAGCGKPAEPAEVGVRRRSASQQPALLPAIPNGNQGGSRQS